MALKVCVVLCVSGGEGRADLVSRWHENENARLGVDRGSKATLPLTIPRRVFKSSAKDSTRRSVGITFQGGLCGSSAARASPTARASGDREVPTAGRQTGGGRTRRSSPDSDLEAFSHNPAHGSFAPLAFQPSAMTNCANQRFLSY
ncbi:hypothetical protein EZV62_027948 [Acer yangbiense]|uniref:Uncharacterized protein n=1 Tax=Acer yangbiense TaxID=1000413 RepID=A0A5C7GPM2_9ROSI|nr:hypothetical protein EZV62_027948 [Acer yangbiense]